jgi:uncharacterized membrane protein YhaH (DUF805 family)
MSKIEFIGPHIVSLVILLWMLGTTKRFTGYQWLIANVVISYGLAICRVLLNGNSFESIHFYSLIQTFSVTSECCFIFFVYAVFSYLHTGIDDSKRIFSFSGRVSRISYWIVIATSFSAQFVMINSLFQRVSFERSMSIFSQNNPGSGDALFYINFAFTALFVLALSIIVFAVTSRRLHDIGRSGKLCLLRLIPVAGDIFMLWLGIMKGNSNANIYGPLPQPASNAFCEFEKAFSCPDRMIHDNPISKPGYSITSWIAIVLNAAALLLFVYMTITEPPQKGYFITVFAVMLFPVVNLVALIRNRSSNGGFFRSYLERKNLESQRKILEEKQKIRDIEKNLKEL